MYRRFSFILLLALCPQLALSGEKPWTEIRSPHFRVLTDGSVGDARKAAYEFEQLRNVFANRFPNARLDSGAPLLVFAVRNEDTAKRLEPRQWKVGANRAGEFHHGWERQFAIVLLDSWGGEGSREVVYHEYTHSIERENQHYLPLWLDEGTAEFYGFTRFQGSQVFLGAPTERYQTMRQRTPIPVETLISVTPRSSYYVDPQQNQLFYAQAWALVHFLTYGKGMENGSRLGQFNELLQQGVDQKKAFQQVFGDFKTVDKALGAYMLQPTFTTTIVKNLPKVDENAFAVRVTTAAETEAELGEFHLWTRDLAGARSLIEQALQDNPQLGLAHEGMGFLDFNEGKDAEAEQEFSKACALDGNLYLSQFYKIMLSGLARSEKDTDMNAFGAGLGKVLQLKADFAPAYVQLAKLALREGDLNAALQISRKAEELEPSLAGYHILTGEIFRRMGKMSEAAGFAKYVAERWVGPDHDEAAELWNRIPASQRTASEIAADTLAKDTQVAEGTIRTIECPDATRDGSVKLDSSDQAFKFDRKTGSLTGYSDTIWYGADHFSLCHHLEGMRAVIRYHAATDQSNAATIVEIGIRDDLPKTPEGTASN